MGDKTDEPITIKYTPAGLCLVFDALALMAVGTGDLKTRQEINRHLAYMAGRFPKELKDSEHYSTYSKTP